MAARYWVGGANTWNSTASTKWASTSGGAGGASAPTAADDVFFDAASGANTVTIATGATARSMNCTGFTGTLSHTSGVTLSLGDATAGASNIALKLSSGMTYTLGSTSSSAITLASTSTTQQSIDTAGKTMGPLTLSGSGGNYILSSSLTLSSAASLTLTRGTLDTNSQAVSMGFFSSNNSNTRTLILGASAITLTATSGGVWDFSTTPVTGLTFNPGTSSITVASGGTSFLAADQAFYTLNGPGGTLTLSGTNPSFVNLNFIPAAGTGFLFVLNCNITYTNMTLQCTDSASVGARGWVTPAALSNPTIARTITSASGNLPTLRNVDFTDIIVSGSSSWTGAALADGSSSLGDGGGNTGITFDASRTLYWVGTAGAWTSIARWAGSSGGATGSKHIPRAHDDVYIDANSALSAGGTFTLARVLGRNMDFSAANQAFTFSAGLTPSAIHGSFVGKTGTTYSGTGQLAFNGRGSHTVNFNGGSIAFSASPALRFNGYGGTYTLAGDLIVTSSTGFDVVSGGFSASIYNVTTASFASSNSNTRTVNMGSGTWSLTGTGTVWNTGTATGLTLTYGTSTLAITDTSSTAKTITKASATEFYNVSVTGGGTGEITWGSNTTTINGDLTIGAPKTISFAAGTSSALRIVGNVNVEGTVGNLITMYSRTAGTRFILRKASGTVNCNYLSLTDSQVEETNWFAGPNSTNVSNNSGWIFTAANYAMSKSLQYTVRVPGSITKGVIYAIRATRVAITKAMTYRIKTAAAALTKSLGYQVRSSLAITKQVKYAVRTTATALTKSLQYVATAGVTSRQVAKSLRYAIRLTPTAITKTLRYAVRITWGPYANTPQFVQQTTGNGTASGISLPSMSVTAGNGIIVVVGLPAAATIPTVTDNLGRTYTRLSTTSDGIMAISYFHTLNMAAGGATTISINNNGQVHDTMAIAREYRNVSSAYSNNNNTGTSSTPSGQVYADDQDLVLFATANSSSMGQTVGAGYSNLGTQSINARRLAVEDTTKTGSSFITGTFNQSGSSAWLIVGASYHATLNNSRTPISRNIRYAILKSGALTKALTYRLRPANLVTKPLAYVIKRPVAITKALVYRLRLAPVAITKSSRYVVRRVVSITKELSYRVPNIIALPLSYKLLSLGWQQRNIKSIGTKVVKNWFKRGIIR